MSKRCTFTLRLAGASAIALVSASASLADPNLTNVSPHQHTLTTPNGGSVSIGPNICRDPDLQDAFNQFHYNVHRSGTATLGPQNGAPGLHDGQGAELTAGGCPPPEDD